MARLRDAYAAQGGGELVAVHGRKRHTRQLESEERVVGAYVRKQVAQQLAVRRPPGRLVEEAGRHILVERKTNADDAGAALLEPLGD